MILQMRFPEPTAVATPPVAVPPTPVADTSTDVLRISCGDCRMFSTAACDDCVVTHLLDRVESVPVSLSSSSSLSSSLSSSSVSSSSRRAGTGNERPTASVVVLDRNELATLQLFQEIGMAPKNRHVAANDAASSPAATTNTASAAPATRDTATRDTATRDTATRDTATRLSARVRPTHPSVRSVQATTSATHLVAV